MGSHDGTVRIGSLVSVRFHGDGEVESWLIVSAEENSDPGRGLTSQESPLAKALLGHRAGDQVRVRAPGAVIPATIVEVQVPRP